MWILPTLSRPRQCAMVLDRIRETGCETPGVVFVNGDKNYEDYRYVFSLGVLPKNWEVLYHFSNLGAIGAVNKILEIYPKESWYGFIGDDEFLLPESPNDWDRRLIEAAGDWNISHGWDDWNNGRRFQGFVCIGGKLARAVGYLGVPECFHGWGFDSMWEWMAAHPAFGGGGACRNILVPEIRVNHRHHINNTAPKDSCYTLAESWRDEDKKRFWDWMNKGLPLAAERVKAAKSSA